MFLKRKTCSNNSFDRNAVDIETYLSKTFGVLCAWLPGTKREGITDILFGDFNPKGKLSFTWYTADRSKAIFPYGYGLSY